MSAYWLSVNSFGPSLIVIGLTVLWLDRRGIPSGIYSWSLGIWTVVDFVVSGPGLGRGSSSWSAQPYCWLEPAGPHCATSLRSGPVSVTRVIKRECVESEMGPERDPPSDSSRPPAEWKTLNDAALWLSSRISWIGTLFQPAAGFGGHLGPAPGDVVPRSRGRPRSLRCAP